MSNVYMQKQSNGNRQNEDLLSQSACFEKKDIQKMFSTLNYENLDDILSTTRAPIQFDSYVNQSSQSVQSFDNETGHTTNASRYYESINSDQVQTRFKSRLSNWRVPCAQDIHSIVHWKNLQDKLIDEQCIVEKETQTKTALLQDVQVLCKIYYETYLKQFSIEKLINNQYQLLGEENQMFGNGNIYIKEMIKELQQYPEVLGYVISMQKQKQEEDVIHLTRNIVNAFYENILTNNQLNINLLIFMRQIIQYEFQSIIRFDEFNPSVLHSLSQIVIKQYCERQECKQYAKFLLQDILDTISKNSIQLQVDPNIINQQYMQQLREEKQLQRNNSLFGNKVLQYRIENQKQQSDKQNIKSYKKTEIYTILMREYDSRQVIDPKKKQRDIVSNELQKLLALKNKKAQAEFRPIHETMQQNNDKKQAKDIQSQLEGILQLPFNSDQKINLVLLKEIRKKINQNIANLVQLINSFMEKLFINFYNIPVGIRVMCKIIEREAYNRFPKLCKNDIYQIVSTFLFDCWILPNFDFDSDFDESNQLTSNAREVLKITKDIITNIVKRCPFEDQVMARFNTLINDYSVSMFHYYEELLNLQKQEIKDIYENPLRQFDDVTECYSSCLSLSDIKILCKLTISCNHEQLSDPKFQDQLILNKIIEKAKRILKVNQSEVFLEQRSDPNGNVTTSDQIYIFFYKHQLPGNLALNYKDLYAKSYSASKMNKLDQAKNVLRLLLIKINNIDEIFKLTGLDNVELLTLFNIFQDTYYLNNLHPTNQFESNLQIQFIYLKAILEELPQEYIQNNMHKIFQEMNDECEARMYEFVKIVSKTKADIVRKLNNIQLTNQKQISLLQKTSKNKKLKSIYEAIEKIDLEFCITSKTKRQIFMEQKSIQRRGSVNSHDNAIWVENQSSCIHSQFSTEKLRLLTGETFQQMSKIQLLEPYHSHDIKSFIHIFTNLNELKETLIKSDPTKQSRDYFGVNAAYTEFFNAVLDFLQRNQTDVFEKGDEAQVIEQIEKYLTRQIYDKVYPKDPSYQDISINLRIRSLEWVDYDHLEIQQQNRVDDLWSLAAQKINQMDEFKTASEKLNCLLGSTKIMNDVLSLTQDEAASADTTVPLMIKILLKAQPKRLQSNLNFIELFTDSNKMMSEAGYSFTQLKSALVWLDEVDETQLKITKQEFLRLVHEKEVKIGIKQLKKKVRRERIFINYIPTKEINIVSILQRSLGIVDNM